MASFQHHILRLALTGTTLIVPNKKLNLTLLRELVDYSIFWTFLPWGIRSRKLKLGYLTGEWIEPIGKHKHQAILYLHGGGYAIGSNATHRAMVGMLSKETDTPALIINYRKIPEHTCPAAIEDAFEAYQWLLKKGYQGDEIIVAGDSAGGGLTIALTQKLLQEGVEKPQALVCISPWLDMSMSGASIERNKYKDPFVKEKEMRRWGKVYAGNLPLKSPLVSPLFGDLHNFPPILIQTSIDEILYSDAQALYENALSQNVEVQIQKWKGLIHWWHLFWRWIPEGEDALLNVADFINHQKVLKERLM